MTRTHRSTHRSHERTRAPRPAPPVWLSLLLAAAAPGAVYLLTHPLDAALLAGLVAGRFSGTLAPLRRAGALRRWLARTVRRPRLRPAATGRSD